MRDWSAGAERRPAASHSASAPPSVRMPVRSKLRLAAEALQPAGGALARALDALQALLAALADRDQLGLDLPAALHRQANRVGMGASSQGSACELGFGLARADRLATVK
jgi:hypothetical protein